MEKWKIELSNIEKKFGHYGNYSWTEDIKTIQRLYSKYTYNVEVNVRLLYALNNILVEEYYTDSEGKEMEIMLPQYFQSSFQIFQDNAEYLFFISYILCVAEWYWGVNSDFKSREETLVLKMSRKAAALEFENKLYQWGFLQYCTGKEEESFLLAKEILFGSDIYLSWLRSKGFPGDDVIDGLWYTYKNYPPKTYIGKTSFPKKIMNMIKYKGKK